VRGMSSSNTVKRLIKPVEPLLDSGEEVEEEEELKIRISTPRARKCFV
jgi:hypothetical protein